MDSDAPAYTKAYADRIITDHAQAAQAQRGPERAALAEQLRYRLDGPEDVWSLVDWFVAAYDSIDALAPSAGQEEGTK
jgi:hypothetical protein